MKENIALKTFYGMNKEIPIIAKERGHEEGLK